jgi:hypothetical protein
MARTTQKIVDTSYLDNLEEQFDTEGSVAIDLRNVVLPQRNAERLLKILEAHSYQISALHCGDLFRGNTHAIERLNGIIIEASLLNEFTISGISLDADQATALAKALNENKSVKILHLQRIMALSPKAAEQLGLIFKELPLQQLVLADSMIPGLPALLAPVVRENKELTSLDVTGSSFQKAEQSEINKFAYALKHNKTLKKLNIETSKEWWKQAEAAMIQEEQKVKNPEPPTPGVTLTKIMEKRANATDSKLTVDDWVGKKEKEAIEKRKAERDKLKAQEQKRIEAEMRKEESDFKEGLQNRMADPRDKKELEVLLRLLEREPESITGIDLSQMKMEKPDDVQMKRLFKLLRNNTHVKHLDLTDAFNKNHLEPLIKFLLRNTEVESILLTNNDLHTEEVNKVLAAVRINCKKDNSHLATIDLTTKWHLSLDKNTVRIIDKLKEAKPTFKLGLSKLVRNRQSISLLAPKYSWMVDLGDLPARDKKQRADEKAEIDAANAQKAAIKLPQADSKKTDAKIAEEPTPAQPKTVEPLPTITLTRPPPLVRVATKTGPKLFSENSSGPGPKEPWKPAGASGSGSGPGITRAKSITKESKNATTAEGRRKKPGGS